MYDLLLGWSDPTGDTPVPVIQSVAALEQRGIVIPDEQVLEFGWHGYDSIFKVERVQGDRGRIIQRLAELYDGPPELREQALRGDFMDQPVDDWLKGDCICWDTSVPSHDWAPYVKPYVKA